MIATRARVAEFFLAKISTGVAKSVTKIFDHFSFKFIYFVRFNGVETSCRTAHNLGNLLMNSNCFAFFLAAF